MSRLISKVSFPRHNNNDYTAALDILNRLHEHRHQSAPRSKSASARDRTRRWLQLLGINQEELETTHFVHVAGTKGKGTTCLYCESIMTEYRKMANKSLKIGCLTSPHVTDIRERIRLNGSPISKQLFADHFFDVWGKMQQEPSGPSLPGFPGFLSLLGIYIFVKEMVDVAIVETGIGGENDSTNIISTPVATGITTIGLDHVKTLGDNLASIAWHKAGIFKKNSPAYTVEQDDTVLRMLQDRAREKGTYGGLTVVPDGLAECYAVRVEPDMVFQQRNASLAIALADSCLKVLDPGAVMTPALASSIEKTELPGRSLVLRSESLEWYISSAHDELSIEVASSWYSNAVIQSDQKLPRIVLYGHAFGKDSDRNLQKLFAILKQSELQLDHLILCSPVTGLEATRQDFVDPRWDRTPTLASLHELAARWSRTRAATDVTVMDSVEHAIDFIHSRYGRLGARILVVGSVYQAGAVMIIVGMKKEGETSQGRSFELSWPRPKG